MNHRNEKSDRKCIRIFSEFLEKMGRPVCGVDRWPEDDAHGEIDAIIGPYAVQHTSVDSLPDGRHRDVQFCRVIGGLEDEYRNRLGFRLQVTIHWNAIKKGQDWKLINQALRGWINDVAPTMPDGCHRLEGIVGIPFALVAEKGGPLKSDGVVFARYDPCDQTLSSRLRDQLVGRHDKLTQLAAYRARNCKALLLLESWDIALMSDLKLVEAFEDAFPTKPENIDELWFVHHVAPPQVNIHDLLAGQTWIFDPSNRNVIHAYPHRSGDAQENVVGTVT